MFSLSEVFIHGKNWVDLHERCPAGLLVKKYRQPLGCGGIDHLYFQLDQQAVVLWVGVGADQIHPGVAAGHTLALGQDGLLGFWRLAFEEIAPYSGAIARSPRQGTLLYVEGIGEIALDQLKVQQGELFVLIYGVESYERGHSDIYPFCMVLSCASSRANSAYCTVVS